MELMFKGNTEGNYLILKNIYHFVIQIEHECKQNSNLRFLSFKGFNLSSKTILGEYCFYCLNVG